MKFRYAVLFAVMVAACDDDPDERPTDADTLATAIVDTNADSSAGAREQIGFERSRTFDFDGDGTDEIVSLSGSGPAWDSLNMTLRIQRTDNTVLWTDTFSTAMHTGLDPDPALTREQIDAQVRRELEQVLGNQSIVSTRENFDSNMDLRSAAPWMTEEEFARFQEDVVGRPMFRYYKGGESNVGITWSGVLKRFVQTLGCC